MKATAVSPQDGELEAVETDAFATLGQVAESRHDQPTHGVEFVV
jgi:ribosomal protein L2